jgi:hypothetical protein
MKIERNVQKIDEGDVFYVEPRGSSSLAPASKKKRNAFRRLVPFVITAVFVSVLTLGIVKYTTPQHFGLEFVLKAANGKVALTQSQLRDIVVGEGLVVYWLGPEDGALYTLISVNQRQNYVRYLPGGQGLSDIGANFRVVGTYEAKDAYKMTQNQATTPDGLGETTADGMAIYYNTTHPLSVYVAPKGGDSQIELFNPTAGQALADARTPGLLRRFR